MTDEHRLKYPRLNLNIDAQNQPQSEKTLLRETRPLDQYAFDVLTIIIRWVQIQGILWLLGASYPWNRTWLDITSWSLLFNLDFYNFFVFHGTNYIGLFAHTIIILLIYPVLSLFFYVAYRLIPRDERTGEIVGYQRGFYNFVMICAQLFYMPLAIAFFRAFVCTDDIYFVDTAPLTAVALCDSTKYYISIIVAIVCGLPFLLGVPIYFVYSTTARLIVDDAFLHERYLIARETEYMLGLNDLYVRHRLPLFASYTRLWACFRALDCQQCLFFAGFAILLGPAMSGNSTVAILSAVFVMLTAAVLWFVRIFMTPTFRQRTCNLMQHVSDCSVFVTAVIALVTAGNPAGMLVSVDRVIPPLAIFNGAALALLVVLAIIGAGTHTWKTSEADILDICVGNSALLLALDSAQALQQEALFAPAEFFPKYKIKEIVTLLKQYHADFTHKLQRMRRGHDRLPLIRFARRELAMDPGKAMELNTQRKDIGVALLWTIEDTIEDLVHLYGALRHTLSAFDEEGGTHSERFRRMRECLRGLGRSLRQKAADRVLMHPEKHMLIRKLLVLRSLVGNDFITSTRATRRFQRVGPPVATSPSPAPLYPSPPSTAPARATVGVSDEVEYISHREVSPTAARAGSGAASSTVSPHNTTAAAGVKNADRPVSSGAGSSRASSRPDTGVSALGSRPGSSEVGPHGSRVSQSAAAALAGRPGTGARGGIGSRGNGAGMGPSPLPMPTVATGDSDSDNDDDEGDDDEEEEEEKEEEEKPSVKAASAAHSDDDDEEEEEEEEAVSPVAHAGTRLISTPALASHQPIGDDDDDDYDAGADDDAADTADDGARGGSNVGLPLFPAATAVAVEREASDAEEEEEEEAEELRNATESSRSGNGLEAAALLTATGASRPGTAVKSVASNGANNADDDEEEEEEEEDGETAPMVGASAGGKPAVAPKSTGDNEYEESGAEEA